MAPDSSRSAELRAQIEASKRQQSELERRADELRRQAEQCGAERLGLEDELTLALVSEAAASNATASLLAGDGITDDTLLHIASFLPTASDLLRVQLTSKRFGARCIAAPSSGGGGPASAAAASERLSLAEEAARRWVAGRSEQERGWVQRRELESWLRLMHEVSVLRLPLAFGRAHASVTLSENGAVATKSGGGFRTAASKVVMRSGRHFVQFTVAEGSDLLFGVVRPGWDVEGGAEAEDVDGHCFYETLDGSCWPGGNHDWEGKQHASEQGDRVGMLLDLDQGSMTVWKNDEKMGIMQAEGLSGPLCWAVSLYHQNTSARIESAVAPASPTAEELAAAKAFEDSQADESDDDE